MDFRPTSKVHIANLNNNLLKKNQGKNFLTRLNILLGFKERSQKSLALILIVGIIIVGGIAASFLFFNQQPDTASASLIQDDLLDATFGESGQIPILEIENKSFLNPKFLEYKEGIIGVGTATDKMDTNQKNIAVVYLNNDGSLNTQFNKTGYSIISYTNKPTIEVVDSIIQNDNIFVLSRVNDCNSGSDLQTCGASDVLVTKISMDGQKVETYGRNGLAQFNLSEDSSLSKPGEREDFPSSIIGFTGGRVAFLSSYQYQNKESFVTGFKVVYLDNKGLVDEDQAISGIQKFNHKDNTVLSKNGDYENLRPMALTATDRNAARIEFTKGNNIYGEIVLDGFGKIRKINDRDINLITADTKLFGEKEVRLNARKSITGKVIFYGSCNPNDNGGWQSVCLVRYLNSGSIDTSFAKASNNIFNLEYIGGDFVFEYGVNNFLEDPVTQQLALSVSVRTAQNTKTINEVLLLKPTGQFNTNFANKGVWRTSTNLIAKNFLTTGKLLATDSSRIYRLTKPLFIDPVITKINPNSASILGGLKVTIEGDNFIKNPNNPQFTEAKSSLKTTTSGSVISGYQTIPDKQNGSYVVGTFTGSLSLKDKVFQTTESETDIFISKINSDTEMVWGLVGGGLSGDDTVLKIAVDNNQNLYILGSTNSDLSLFSSSSLDTPQESNLFLAKYTTSGQFSWVKKFKGNLSSIYTDLIVTNNNIFVGGNFNGNLSFDSSTTSSRESQGFVASLDSGNGSLNWVQTINSANQTQLQQLKLNSSGEIVAFGTTNGNINVGFDTINSLGSKDIFILKYDNSGKVIMGQILGGVGIDEFEDGLITTAGDIVLTADFSADPISNIENNGGFFVLKLASNGQKIWATPGRGLLKEDSNQNIVVYGLFQEQLQLGTQLFSTEGQNQAFGSKLNKDGKLLWAHKWGGSESNTISDIYIDNDDNVYFGGAFKDSANFNNILLTSLGESDLYILKYNQSGDQVWVKQGGGKNQDLNLKFASSLDKGDLKFLALVNGLSNFDKLAIPSDLTFNLISGNLYDQDLSVYFGNRLASKLEIVDKNKLLITVPSNIEGFTDVRVIGYDGSETVFPKSFEYTSSININLDQNPNSGSGTSRI